MINTSCQSTPTDGENVRDPKASSGCPACQGLCGGKWWQSGNLLCCPGALTASSWEQKHRWSPSSQRIGDRYCLPTPTLLCFKSEMARGYLRAPLRMPGAGTEAECLCVLVIADDLGKAGHMALLPPAQLLRGGAPQTTYCPQMAGADGYLSEASSYEESCLLAPIRTQGRVASLWP